MTTPSSIPTDVYIAGSTGQTKIHDFNPGRKSWQMYAHKISTIGDNLIFEAIGTNSEIYFKQKNNEVYKITDLLGGGNSYDDGQAIIIGYNAGLTDPSNHSIAIGNEAAQSDNLQYSIAIGYQANKTSNPGGYTSDNGYNIAIGYQAAGQVPSSAPPYGSNYNNISIGHQAGYKATYSNTINIGHQSGYENQNMNTIGIGLKAAYKSQNLNSIAIGNLAAYLNQSTNAIAIGNNAGKLYQGTTCVAIGDGAGIEYQGWYGIAVGYRAGYIQQGGNSIAIGRESGNYYQGNFSVGIGHHAGEKNQGNESVAIGRESGNETQGSRCIAIGYNSGNNIQSNNAIAIGYEAAMNNQGANSICIGYNAGRDNQGLNSLAIGYNASATNEKSIVLNATGITLNSSSSNALFIKPIRSNTNSNKLLYNSSTGEITYQPDSGGGGTLLVDSITELTPGNGVNIAGGVNITGTNITGINTISAQNFNIGSTNAISAARQGNFRDLEVKSGTNQSTFLVMGDSGDLSMNGTLTVDNITEQTTGNGVNIAGGVNITGTNITGINAISAQNFNIGSTNAISAARQGNFRDLEVKSGANQTTFLVTGDSGDLTMNGTLTANSITANSISITGIVSLANSNKLLYNSSTGEITYQPDSSDLYLDGEAINIGYNAGLTDPSNHSIAIGNQAGETENLHHSIAIGYQANKKSFPGWGADMGLDGYNIAIGYQAAADPDGYGPTTPTPQNSRNISIGYQAGYQTKNSDCVSIGSEAGKINQASKTVAIGNFAGKNDQEEESIAIGRYSGHAQQGYRSIAIGWLAGGTLQGANSIAIGTRAGASNQNQRSIILNATGSSLYSSHSDALFIKPIRSDTNSNKLLYNSSTGEITYQPDSGGGIDTTIGKAITGTWATSHNSAFWAFHTMNDATKYALRQDQAGETYINSGYNRLHFLIEGVNQMRLTTTGLGIGNTAPTEKLDVTGNIKASGSITANSISVTGLDTTIGKAITGTWATSHNSAFWAFHTMNDATKYALRQDQAGETYINSGYNRVHFLIEGQDYAGLNTTGLCIGTTLTQERLHVNGNIILEAYEYNTSGGKGIFFRKDYCPSNTANFYNCSITTFDHENTNSPAGLSINCIDGASICTGSDEYRLERFRVAQNGNVGIGTTSPSEKLEVDGNIKSSGSFLGSDDRLKHNEEDIVNALSVMRKLKPQKYEKTKELKAADFNGSLDEDDILCVEAGFIAQDIQNVPELDYSVVGGDYIKETVDPSGVVTTNTVSKPYYLNYNNILTYNVAATQELDTIVSSLLAEIASLKERISALEN